MRKSSSVILGGGEGVSQFGTWTVLHLDRSVQMVGTFEAVVIMLLPAGTTILYNDGHDDHIVALKGKITKKAKRMFSLFDEDE